MKNTILKDTLALVLITLVAGAALGGVYTITADPIAHQNQLAKDEAYKAVFADADTFEVIIDQEDAQLEAYLDENGYPAQTINEVVQAMDSSGSPLGYAFTVTTSEGYGGDIQFAMGVKDDQTLNGISILSISETAGLGMKADTDEFKGQFADKNVEAFQYTKNGASADNEIDALSGATITTNAVVNGVNAGLCAFAYEKGGN
ncbi:MAG: RnfABCDGE type electron transport complex subunit G [Lachnospiraceae bacterium]|jgi:electron transport complex protein RnfG|nr:RnfABCDGE type electron transport complex subunit G [Lachnospiraceae bacterium]MCI9098547.1 RnfABCDGE type electron transport complex subunit G [Lachnospiraceae bacterium]MCI9357369.1 RnfABCDGE type electron transport complex subunit G [Lachnospiraceae bacterium]